VRRLLHGLMHAQNSRDGCPLLGNIPFRFADLELVDGVQFVASQPLHVGERDVVDGGEAVLAQQSNHVDACTAALESAAFCWRAPSFRCLFLLLLRSILGLLPPHFFKAGKELLKVFHRRHRLVRRQQRGLAVEQTGLVLGPRGDFVPAVESALQRAVLEHFPLGDVERVRPNDARSIAPHHDVQVGGRLGSSPFL
jgi:hypothetical protein